LCLWRERDGVSFSSGFSIKAFSGAPLNYKTTILAESSVQSLWLFDAASGTAITDYKGTNTITLSGGAAVNQTGLLTSDATTCTAFDGTGKGAFGTGSTFNFAHTDSFAIEVVCKPNCPRTGSSSAYPLISKLENSGSFHGWELQLQYNPPDQPNKMVPRFYFAGSGGTAMDVWGTCDIPNGETVSIKLEHSYVGGAHQVSMWVNGCSVELHFFTWNPSASSTTTTVVPAVGIRPGDSSGGFVGSIQSVAIFNSTLSELATKTHWLATQNESYTSGHVYPSFKGVDNNGDPLRLSCTNVIYDSASSKYYAYGMDTSVADVLGSFGYDQNNVKVLVYSSVDLVNWTYEGVAVDASGVSGIWSLTRFHIIGPNPSTGKYVGWGHLSLNSDYSTDQYALIAYADTPVGPFTIYSSSYQPDSVAVKDTYLFLDDDGASAYLVYTFANQAGVRVNALASDWLSSVSSSVTTIAAMRESPVLFRSGSTYFLLTSAQEFYSGSQSNDVKYSTASSPTGTWSTHVSAMAYDPTTTPFNSQPASVLRRNDDPTKFIYMGDYWHNRMLDQSGYVWAEIDFPTSSTISINPVGILQVSEVVDSTPPTLDAPEVAVDGTTITATLSESGCTPTSGTEGFTLSGTNATVASWAISGTTLTITLSGTVLQGETVALSYNTVDGAIVDAADNALASFDDVAVTNNSTVVPEITILKRNSSLGAVLLFGKGKSWRR
jgi:hypothetical protein